jgi:glyoxylate utilization-related uncharacterized protein
MLSMRSISKDPEKPGLGVCKAFNVTEERWAAGLLEVPPLGEKPIQSTKANFLVFFVAGPAIEATIHNSTFQLNKGSMFFVPPGTCCHSRDSAPNIAVIAPASCRFIIVVFTS